MIDLLSEFSELQTAYKFRPSPEGVKVYRGILIALAISIPLDYLIVLGILAMMRAR